LTLVLLGDAVEISQDHPFVRNIGDLTRLGRCDKIRVPRIAGTGRDSLKPNALSPIQDADIGSGLGARHLVPIQD
jgi:hypothetical protein